VPLSLFTSSAREARLRLPFFPFAPQLDASLTSFKNLPAQNTPVFPLYN
jgi:hypothetical protein